MRQQQGRPEPTRASQAPPPGLGADALGGAQDLLRQWLLEPAACSGATDHLYAGQLLRTWPRLTPSQRAAVKRQARALARSRQQAALVAGLPD